MLVSLIDMDYEYRVRVLKRPPRNRFPNLALMKISAYHKSLGDTVDRYPPFMRSPDKIYISKVFTFYHDCVDLAASDPEPLLGPIDMQLQYIPPEDMPFGWVVVGAESGPNRRPCKIDWVRSIVRQCRTAGIKVFVKQLDIDGKLEKDITKFPADLQIRQVPWSER